MSRMMTVDAENFTDLDCIKNAVKKGGYRSSTKNDIVNVVVNNATISINTKTGKMTYDNMYGNQVNEFKLAYNTAYARKIAKKAGLAVLKEKTTVINGVETVSLSCEG